MVIVTFRDVIVLENLCFSAVRRLRFPRISLDAWPNCRNKASFFQFLQPIMVGALVNNRISAFNTQKAKTRKEPGKLNRVSGATLSSCRKVGDGGVLFLS